MPVHVGSDHITTANVSTAAIGRANTAAWNMNMHGIGIGTVIGIATGIGTATGIGIATGIKTAAYFGFQIVVPAGISNWLSATGSPIVILSA